jgi:hypothetical protein
VNRSRWGIVGMALVLGAVLLAPKPASAICIYEDPVYDTGTLTGTGGTCSQAQSDLESNLHATALQNCIAIYGQYASVDSFTETLNGCEPNGVGQLETGSAEYTCKICGCFGPRCT